MDEFDVFLDDYVKANAGSSSCISTTKSNALDKSTFVFLVQKHKENKEKERIRNIKKLENESKSYIIDKMIYNRKQRNRRGYR